MHSSTVMKYLISSRLALVASIFAGIFLAGCAPKPIIQDLPDGDGSVDFKYLDAVSVATLDELREKRREFYSDALNERELKYSQGRQGAIDRVSTFAAAIGVNAQRDEGVLERYQAANDLDVTGIENSKIVDTAKTNHTVNYIDELDGLNTARANSEKNIYESQGKALSEVVDFLVSRVKGIEETIKVKEGKKLTLQSVAVPDTNKINALTTQIDTLVATKTQYIEKLIDVSNINTTDIKLEEITSAITLAMKEQKGGAEVVTTPDRVVILNNGVPQVNSPENTSQLQQSLKSLNDANTSLNKLVPRPASSDTALSSTNNKVQSPPIERIRNDEAVFDYLIDGYRSSQLFSGAAYGGNVQRVLPFNFTFNPGKNTKSGFSARVILEPDLSQIDSAVTIVKRYFDSKNQNRMMGYLQIYDELEKSFNIGTFAHFLLLEKIKNSTKIRCVDKFEKDAPVLLEQFSKIFEAKIADSRRRMSLKSPDTWQFWNAYSLSLEAVDNSLKNGNSKVSVGQYLFEITPNALQSINEILVQANNKNVSLTQVAKKINSLSTDSKSKFLELIIPKIKGVRIEGESIMDMGNDESYKFIDWYLPVHEKGCSVSNTFIDKIGRAPEVSSKSSIKEDDHDAYHIAIKKYETIAGEYDLLLQKLLNEVGELTKVITSSILAHEMYLNNNQLFKDSPSIKISVDSKKENIVQTLGYVVEFPNAGKEFLKKKILKFSSPRIVSNTSREHVVEIADTAAVNTILDVAITANEVSASLGLTLGAELAAAISSSTAFVKRIPYAVPFTTANKLIEKDDPTVNVTEDETSVEEFPGNNFIVQEPTGKKSEGKNDGNLLTKQMFGWKFFKVPAGVEIAGPINTGNIVHAFKTTPINSSVVVTMPEWLMSLTAKYETSQDGITWMSAGQEHIQLPGAGLKEKSFETWVNYYINMKPGQHDLPKIQSCENVNNINIFAVPGAKIVLCGENLYGTKGISIGGQYIEDLTRVSNNLLLVDSSSVATHECWEESADNQYNENQCRIIALSDFGSVSESDTSVRVVWVTDKKAENEKKEEVPAASKIDIFSTAAGYDLSVQGYNENGSGSLTPQLFLIGNRIQKTWASVPPGSLNTLSVAKKEMDSICYQRPEEDCVVRIDVFEKGTGFRLLQHVDMKTQWKRFVDPNPSLSLPIATKDNKSIITIHSKHNSSFPPEVLVGRQNQKLPVVAGNINPTTFTVEVLTTDLKNYCNSSVEKNCPVAIRYKNINKDSYNLGSFKLNI